MLNDISTNILKRFNPHSMKIEEVMMSELINPSLS